MADEIRVIQYGLGPIGCAVAILAATIIPQFANSTTDAETNVTLVNLRTLRSQIQVYQAQHSGKAPGASLEELIRKTDHGGNIGAGNPYGPYLPEIPENLLTQSSAVKVITNSPAQATDVSDTDGWLYNATTGEVWISHAEHYTD